MRFTMIKYDGETVTLSRVEQGANEADAIERTSTNEPNPEFKRALTAFRRHVLDCAPSALGDRLDHSVGACSGATRPRQSRGLRARNSGLSRARLRA
jgi:hypothetical protein